jgi:hypothetical protein
MAATVVRNSKKSPRLFIQIGYTDMRKGIHKLSESCFAELPNEHNLFCAFCNKDKNIIKIVFVDNMRVVHLIQENVKNKNPIYDWPNTTKTFEVKRNYIRKLIRDIVTSHGHKF